MYSETCRYTVFWCPNTITHNKLFSKYTDFLVPKINLVWEPTVVEIRKTGVCTTFYCQRSIRLLVEIFTAFCNILSSNWLPLGHHEYSDKWAQENVVLLGVKTLAVNWQNFKHLHNYYYVLDSTLYFQVKSSAHTQSNLWYWASIKDMAQSA